MDAVIEYISAGLIICLVLGFAGQYAASMNYDKLALIERDATTGKADRVIDMLLLSTGMPVDWGRTYDDPSVFGLAIENSVKLYQLDPDKVRRLDPGSPDYIPPGRVRDLVGLSSCYYLSLKIFPFFNITIVQVDSTIYSVNVTNQWGVPVANVKVTGACVDVSTESIGVAEIAQFLDSSLEEAHYASSYTNLRGECLLSFMGSGSSVIVVSNQLNMESVTTWPTLSPAVIGVIESSMGTVSGYNAETVSRNVSIDGLDYVARLVLWS